MSFRERPFRGAQYVRRERRLIIPLLLLPLAVFLPLSSARQFNPHALPSLLYTSDTLNFLEPCGCRATGTGGLPRRATVIERIRRESKNVLLLDTGNWGDDPVRRFVIARGMATMRYDVAGIGELDLKSKDHCALAQQEAVPLLATTARPTTIPDSVPKTRELKLGDRGIGVVALLPVAVADASVLRTLTPVLSDLRSRCELIVAVSQQGLSRDEELALALDRSMTDQTARPAIDVIIGNGTAESLTAPIVRGRTTIVPTSSKGQHLGRLEVDFSVTPPKFSARLIPLDREIPDHPKVAELIGQFFADEMARLVAIGVDDSHQDFAAIDVKARYVKSEQCAECHEKAYTQWQKSKHAKGLLTLIEKKRLAPQCLKCHSEHFRRTGKLLEAVFQKGNDEPRTTNAQSSFVNHQSTIINDGIACTTCHGDGVVHSLTESKKQITRTRTEAFCKTCHDKENDDRFNYKKDLQAIRHW